MRFIAVLVAFFALLFSSCEPEPKFEFTSEVLKQTVFNTEGQAMTFGELLGEHKGKTIVIEVWASWCGDCVKALPKMRDFQKNHADLAYIFLSVDDDKDRWKDGVEKYMGKYNIKGDQYTFEKGWEKDGSNPFVTFASLDWIPRYMVVGKDGDITKYYAKSLDDKDLLKAIAE